MVKLWILMIYMGINQMLMFNYIKENLNFDQMIWEFGNEENPDWVHVVMLVIQ